MKKLICILGIASMFAFTAHGAFWGASETNVAKIARKMVRSEQSTNTHLGIGTPTPAANLDVPGSGHFGSLQTTGTVSVLGTGPGTLNLGASNGVGGMAFQASAELPVNITNIFNFTNVVAGQTLCVESSNNWTVVWGLCTPSGGWTDDGTAVRLTTVTDNVGIGTNTPVATLEVQGSVRVSSGITNSGPVSLNGGNWVFFTTGTLQGPGGNWSINSSGNYVSLGTSKQTGAALFGSFNATTLAQLHVTNSTAGQVAERIYQTGVGDAWQVYAPANGALTGTNLIASLNTNGGFTLNSTNAGLALMRMTKAQRDTIATPREGTMVYQTDNTPGLRTWNGANWMRYTETAD